MLPQAPKSRRRRLSLCSLPVPKQFEVSLKSFLRCPGDLLQDLAACASNDLVFVLPYQEAFHVGHQLPGYRQGGPILVPSLDFLLPEQGQFVGVPGRQLGGFHQYVLDVLVPLLGNRHALYLVGRALLGAA